MGEDKGGGASHYPPILSFPHKGGRKIMRRRSNGMNALDSLYFTRSELFLSGALLVILILDFFVRQKKWLGWLSFISIVIAFIIPSPFYPDEGLFFDSYVWDPFTFFFKTAVYLIIGLTILASLSYEKIPESEQGEFYVLLLAMAVLLTLMSGELSTTVEYMLICLGFVMGRVENGISTFAYMLNLPVVRRKKKTARTSRRSFCWAWANQPRR